METKTKIFVNGLISKDVPETAPEFILGKMSVKVSELAKWLEENKGLAENDWLNLTVMRSRTSGKRYIEVDTYKPKTETSAPSEPVTTGGYAGEVADTSGIPF